MNLLFNCAVHVESSNCDQAVICQWFRMMDVWVVVVCCFFLSIYLAWLSHACVASFLLVTQETP